MCDCKFILPHALQAFLTLVEVKQSSSIMPGEYLRPEVCRIEKKNSRIQGVIQAPGSWLSTPTPHTGLAPWVMFLDIAVPLSPAAKSIPDSSQSPAGNGCAALCAWGSEGAEVLQVSACSYQWNL